MVPENQHRVVRRILIPAEAQEVCQCIRDGGRDERQVCYFVELAAFVEKALGAVRINHLVAPSSSTAGLNDNLNVVGPGLRRHLSDILGGGAGTVGNNDILGYDA